MRKLPVILVALLAALISVGGYTTYSSAAPAGQKPIELKLATVAPPQGTAEMELKWFASEVEKRTNGVVKIKIGWAGSFAGPKEMPEAIRTGSIDIAHLPWPVFAPSLFPLHTITERVSPFRGSKPLANWMAAIQLHKEFPELDAEYASNNMIRMSWRGNGGQNVETKKPVRTLEDLKGLKMAATGAMFPAMLKVVGAVPVFVTPDQVLDNMQKGVLDGSIEPVGVSVRFKIYEAVKYIARFEPSLGGDGGFCNTVNLDSWKKLPPDVQKVFLDLRDEYPFKFAEFDSKDTETAYKTVRSAGIQVVDPPTSETQRWISLAAPLNFNEEWVKHAAKNTKVPEQRLRQMLARYLELIDEMQKKYPQGW